MSITVELVLALTLTHGRAIIVPPDAIDYKCYAMAILFLALVSDRPTSRLSLAQPIPTMLDGRGHGAEFSQAIMSRKAGSIRCGAMD
jgi:hypothetical protein